MLDRTRAVSITVVLSMLVLMPFFQSSLAQTPPPDLGDWVIEDETVIEGEDIIMRGDIIIQNGGMLHLKDCSVEFECTYPGQFSVRIEEDGTLLSDGTDFNATRNGIGYGFYVSGSLNMCSSDVSNAFKGIQVTGNALIEGTMIHDCFGGELEFDAFPESTSGVFAHENAVVHMEECSIFNNFVGLGTRDHPEVTMQGCNISGNNFDGLYLDGSANVSIDATTISNNFNRGLVLHNGTRVSIMGSTIAGNNGDGISLGRSEDESERPAMRIDGCTVKENGRYAMISFSHSSTNITNSLLCDNNQVGAQFSDWSTAELSNVDIVDNGEDGLLTYSLTQIDMEHCTITGNGEIGMIFQHDTTANLKDVVVSRNLEDGIAVGITNGEHHVRFDMRGGEITRNYGTGLFTSKDVNISMDGTLIKSNGEDGIHLQDYTVGLLRNLSITDNAGIGLTLGQENSESGVTALVKDCNIQRNDNWGIAVVQNAKVTLEKILLKDNIEGLRVELFDEGYLHGSELDFIDNDQLAIAAKRPGDISFKDCLISGHTTSGIMFLEGTDSELFNCTIRDSGYYGIFVQDISRPMLANCSISDSGMYDVWASDNSHPVLINSIFDQSKVFLNDTESDISVGWWVRAEVVDDTGPVPAAQVRVSDREKVLSHSTFTDDQGRTTQLPIVEFKYKKDGKTYMGPYNFTAFKNDWRGCTILNITSNMKVRIVLEFGLHVIEPGETGSDIVILHSISVSDGDWVSGDVTITIKTCSSVDRVTLRLSNGEENRLGTAELASRNLVKVFEFKWDSTNQTNGIYELIIQVQNSSLGIASEKRIDIYVNNPYASVSGMASAIALGTLAAFGASAVVGGGVSAVEGFGGIDDPVGEYVEERLAHRSAMGLPHPGVQGMLVLASTMILGSALAYSHMQDVAEIAEVFGYMLLGAAVVVMVMEGMEAIAIKRFGCQGGFNIWPTGLVALILTTILFKAPFGSPGKTLAGDGSRSELGKSALIKLMAAPALFPVFLFLMHNGYFLMGEIGGYTIVMLFLVDALPVAPLEGHRLFKWSKGAWGLVFLSALFLIFAWSQAMLGTDVYYGIGILSIALLVFSFKR